MSTDRFKLVGRGICASIVTLLSVVAAQSCAFPDHTFVSDDEFYGNAGGTSGGSSQGGADASTSGSGGGTAKGGQGQSGGQGGVNGGGAGNGGGSSMDGGGAVGAGGGGGGGGAGGSTAIGGKGDASVLIDAGAGGSTPDAAVSAGGAGPVDSGPHCGIGLTSCQGVCVDLLTDKNHCGGCYTACTGNDLCTKDGCAPPCTAGLTLCRPTGTTTNICVDTTIDDNNCGGCNKPCPGGFVCEASKCVVDCGTATRCGTQCVDTTTDDANCGTCGNNCKTLGQVCSASQCQANCSFPFIPCGSTCANTQTDPKNCNGCGKACAVGQTCSGGACVKLVENCQNGSDDDQDGLIDCQDPDCTTGFVCAAALPAGWTGPVALWSGGAGTAPSCSASGGYSSALLTANAGLVVPSYQCPSCSCSVAAGTYCDDLSYDIYNDATTPCTGLPWPKVTVPVSGACFTWTLQGSARVSANSARLSNAPASYVHGSCTSTQQTPKFPAATWSTEVDGCAASAAPGGGCGTGQCMPKPAAPFGAKLCIFRAGISTCPADYPVQSPGTGQQYYESIVEGRSCSACGCGLACGGTVKVYGGQSCTTAGDVLSTTDASCNATPLDPLVGSNDHHSFQWTNPGPVCNPAPSTLTGAPAPDSPITVCCQGP